MSRSRTQLLLSLNNQFRSIAIFLTLASFAGIGCSEAPKDESPSNPSQGQSEVKPSPRIVGPEIPPSRYLSKQDTENPSYGTSSRNGYDSEYRMLSFRRLEQISPNPAPGKPGHFEGLRSKASVIRVPFSGDELSSKQLIDTFLEFLNDPKAGFSSNLEQLKATRKANLSSTPNRPGVVISGLGPVGLLSVLEAYLAGSTVIGIEQRSQYTRPQILRLTTDTIQRIVFFTGDRLWEYLRRRGVVSRSPNWVPNKFDLHNVYLYPMMGNMLKQLKFATGGALTHYKNEISALEAQILESFTPEERALRESYLENGFEIENVDIIRINHLETILSAVIETIAQQDPEHLRIFYGSTLKVSPANSNFKAEVSISSGGAVSTFPVKTDVIALSEGAGARIAKDLGIQSNIISNKLYGATAALRLPQGFDIGLRPIENREGTASVKGIAIIDPIKLTAPGTSIQGTNQSYTWTMISETDLCFQLNEVIIETAVATQTTIDSGILLPCGQPASTLSAPWKDRNGGNQFFLPRSRYFFTGGIAYLGAELSERQAEMFQKKVDGNPTIQAASREGLKKFMIILGKKHMPREYVEGQGQHYTVAPEAIGKSVAAADEKRVITVTEESYSLTVFPVELRKGTHFFTMNPFQDSDGKVNSVRIATLGDTYATTHFFTGSGAVNGLRAAIFMGEALTANSEDAWKKAAEAASQATDKMHLKVMDGIDNAPLDGPFNQRLKLKLQ